MISILILWRWGDLFHLFFFSFFHPLFHFHLPLFILVLNQDDSPHFFSFFLWNFYNYFLLSISPLLFFVPFPYSYLPKAIINEFVYLIWFAIVLTFDFTLWIPNSKNNWWGGVSFLSQLLLILQQSKFKNSDL